MSGSGFDAPEEIVWEGDWITAKRRGRWEYATRARNIRAAVIVALAGSEVILVEQFRVPIGMRCLELPAGLVGDDVEDEDPFAAARRELLEETGYEASEWSSLGKYFSSPGMVGESFTLLLARGLRRVADGGGLDGENITVHRIPMNELPDRIEAFRRAGGALDAKLLMLLGGALLGPFA